MSGWAVASIETWGTGGAIEPRSQRNEGTKERSGVGWGCLQKKKKKAGIQYTCFLHYLMVYAKMLGIELS